MNLSKKIWTPRHVVIFSIFFSLLANAPAEEKKDDGHGKPAAPADPHGAPAPAADPHAGSGGHGAAAAPKNEYAPYPRTLLFPNIDIISPDTKKDLNYPFEENRFTFIYVLGTYNPRTAEIVKILNQQVPVLRKRHVGVLGIFSHDTPEAVLSYLKQHQILFTPALASLKFIDIFDNPKVPTFWLINSKKEKVREVATPTNQQIEDLYSKVLLWTKF